MKQWLARLCLHAGHNMSHHSHTWQSLSQLLAMAGGVSYVAYPDRLAANIKSLRESLTARYPRIGIGYSYKTNYLPRFCLEADRLGLYAEVVSGMEYEIARHLGIPGERIIFNGPIKSHDELRRAFVEGALVNVDSLSEAELITSLAVEDVRRPLRVGLRCNLDLQWKGRESRFGLSEVSGELDAAFGQLRVHPNIRIEGLHCHTSFDRSAESYARRMVRLIEIADRLFGKDVPAFLDIGGGICGPMPEVLARQLSIAPPSYEAYAEAICAPLQQRYGNDGPELIIEPGVGLIGNAFDYVYRVEHIKQVGPRWFAVTSGASHQIKIVPNDISPATSLYSAPQPLRGGRSPGPTDLVGFTCLEHDLIVRGLEGSVTAGDIAVSECIGAYSMVISSEFIQTTPPVYEWKDAGWKPLRRRQDTRQLLNMYQW